MSVFYKPLVLVFLVIALIAPVLPSTDFSDRGPETESLTPSKAHALLGRMKAAQLQISRDFQAEALKTSSTYDQTEFDVGFYRIELEIDEAAEVIYGDILIQARANVPGLDSLELDLYPNMVIDSIYNQTGTLGFSHLAAKIFVELDRPYDEGEAFSFSVKYHGSPTPSGLAGFSFAERNGIPIISSLSEPMSARSWWPCKDRPDDKADSLDILITCDTALFCTSNGSLIDTVRNDDGTWTFYYQVRYPITTYLFSVAISKYTVWYDWYHYGDGDSMIIINYVYPDRYEYSLDKYSVTPNAISVYAGLFGQYPFIEEKYGHANFQYGGAMEHQTVSSMSGSDVGFYEPVVVHELAHQWWGDMITCNNWHEIWLNEGFASYCEALFYEAVGGSVAYHAYMDSMFYAGGGAIYIYDTTYVLNIFSPIVYDKGAWVLHMLRHVMGDSSFFDGLRAYYGSACRYSDATTEDFKNIMESVSGTGLDYFFQQWIYGTYLPRYYWSYLSEPDPADGKYWTFFQLRQAQSTDPQVFTMPVDVAFTYTPVDSATIPLFNDARDSIYVFKSEQFPTAVDLDPDHWILKYSYHVPWTYHLIPFPLDTGNVFATYLDSLVVRGGSGRNIFKISSGALPVGLQLDTLTGYIAGVPESAGEFTFDIHAGDSTGGYSETRGYKLVVMASEELAGDADHNGIVNLLDITFLINFLYKGGAAPESPPQADPNADCVINLLDITCLINYLYKGGSAPQWGCAGL
jgi:aminopeptidase N